MIACAQALSTVFNDDLLSPLFNFDRLLARPGPGGRTTQLMRGIPIDVVEVSVVIQHWQLWTPHWVRCIERVHLPEPSANRGTWILRVVSAMAGCRSLQAAVLVPLR